MNYFHRQGADLYTEDVPLGSLAETYGTPCYVYSRASIEAHWQAFDQAFADHDHLICYAVKANSNLAVLNLLAGLGSGFDIVSGGELERVLAAGGDPRKVVFSGIGKSRAEMCRALAVGIRCFNVESEGELVCLNEIAGEEDQRAPVALRVNPDIDAKTHPYISTGLKENKFGIALENALEVYARADALPHIQITGVDCHLGSQLTALAPLESALDRLLELVAELHARDIHVQHLDLGGGLGIRYRDETPPHPAEYAAALVQKLAGHPYQILIEPGRAIVGNTGVLLTRVEHVKHTLHKDFAIVDAAMNDLLRPALYDAWQEIVPVHQRRRGKLRRYDVVGPVCESADFLGKDRALTIEPGDLLAVLSAGAYGFSMSSNYNSRPRPAEILVDGARSYLIRRRETVPELFASESMLPDAPMHRVQTCD
jgi:diaminopimelate decarboxylase